MSSATLSGVSLTQVHDQFNAALPGMQNTLRYHFRRLPRAHRAEAVADGLAACWHSWQGLVRRGRDPVALGPTGIASFAAKYVRNKRRLGTGKGGRGAMDVYNSRARQKAGLNLISLSTSAEPGARPDDWREWLTSDRRVTPADEAVFRIDFERWLSGLPPRKREMAELLAQGNGTGAVAQRLGVTAPAVSIARTWLEASWRRFQGESNPVASNPQPRRPVGRPRAAARRHATGLP